jgi:uncharacterized protein YjbJ (UPF0337 family)
MNWDQITGQWKQLQAQMKSKWAKLTDDDLKNASAKKDEFVGKIQERYGILKEEAERQVDGWLASLSPRRKEPPSAPKDERPSSPKGH